MNRKESRWDDLTSLIKSAAVFQEHDPVLTKEYRLTVPREIRDALPTLISGSWVISHYNRGAAHCLRAVPAEIFETYLTVLNHSVAAIENLRAIAVVASMDQNHRWAIKSKLARLGQMEILSPCVFTTANGVIEIWEKQLWREHGLKPDPLPQFAAIPMPVEVKPQDPVRKQTSSPKNVQRPKTGSKLLSGGNEKTKQRYIATNLYRSAFLNSIVRQKREIKTLRIHEAVYLLCIGHYDYATVRDPKLQTSFNYKRDVSLAMTDVIDEIRTGASRLLPRSPVERKRFVATVSRFLRRNSIAKELLFTLVKNELSEPKSLFEIYESSASNQAEAEAGGWRSGKSRH